MLFPESVLYQRRTEWRLWVQIQGAECVWCEGSACSPCSCVGLFWFPSIWKQCITGHYVVLTRCTDEDVDQVLSSCSLLLLRGRPQHREHTHTVICMSRQQRLPLLCPCYRYCHYPEWNISSEPSLKILIVNVESLYACDAHFTQLESTHESDPLLFLQAPPPSTPHIVSHGQGWITELPLAVHTYIIAPLCELIH